MSNATKSPKKTKNQVKQENDPAPRIVIHSGAMYASPSLDWYTCIFFRVQKFENILQF